MPHISLSLYPGRSKSELEKISKDIQKCLVETAGWKPGDISISIEEIKADSFELKVKNKIKKEKVVIPSDFIK